jgi:predicted RNA-binding protein with PIN domain
MYYIIDGSNMLNKLGLVGKFSGNVIRAREGLQDIILKLANQGQDTFMIVFDVHSEPPDEKLYISDKLSVKFAVGSKEEEPADKMIEYLAAKDKNTQDIRVVTSDTTLLTNLMFKGIKGIKTEEFLKKTRCF